MVADGLLTPPSEEAMLWDMTQLKAMGFNTIRKHIKVEPELYYYYADSLGLMMWQDMVSGFETEHRAEQCLGPYAAKDWNAPAEHARQWEKELFEMIDVLRFYPCVTTYRIAPVVADVLIVDGQDGSKNKRQVSIDGQMQELDMPCVIKENTNVIATSRFSVDQSYTNLSLWLNMSAAVSISLNGHPIFEQNIREFRQPTHFNLSDYAYLLKIGENELRIEARITKRCNFDYGLRAF